MSLWAFHTELTYTNLSALPGFSENTSSALAASGTISISLTDRNQQWLVASSGGAVNLAAAPFGSTAPASGTTIELVGSSDTDTITILYSDTAKGCLVNGDWTSGRGKSLVLRYNTGLARYVEVSRS